MTTTSDCRYDHQDGYWVTNGWGCPGQKDDSHPGQDCRNFIILLSEWHGKFKTYALFYFWNFLFNIFGTQLDCSN